MAAIERGIPYYVYNPSQSKYFALNAPSDPNFVGYVTDITGLDDAGVRENAQVVVAGDGGYHGPFWKDRRPWTISGIVLPIFPLIARDASQELMQGILSQAMQSDGYLKWTPADGNPKMVPFRKQQPTRVTKGQSNVQNNFQIACVTADYRIIGQSLISGAPANLASSWTTPFLVNLGNAPASPKFTIAGPIWGPISITNVQTGKKFTTVNSYTLASGQSLVIDLTGVYPSVADTAFGNQYGQMDPLNTDLTIAVEPSLVVGSSGNQFLLASGGGTSSATSLTVSWYHSWV